MEIYQKLSNDIPQKVLNSDFERHGNKMQPKGTLLHTYFTTKNVHKDRQFFVRTWLLRAIDSKLDKNSV